MHLRVLKTAQCYSKPRKTKATNGKIFAGKNKSPIQPIGDSPEKGRCVRVYEVPEHLVIEQVEAHMRELGISPKDNIRLQADGELHRYCVEGDKAGTKNGAYRIHVDGIPAWYICDWKRQIDVTGRFDDSGLSASDREAYTSRINDKEYMERARIRRETLEYEERKRKREATQKAKELYEQAPPATLEHEYLRHKRIEHIQDFRLGEKGELLIPLHHARKIKDFMSLQRIFPNGKKYFIQDTATCPACYEFEPEEENDRLIFICEGIATGETIYRLTGKRFRVVCAMNCNNLDQVTEGIKERSPRAEILIGADNDLGTYAKTGNNPGRSRAEFVVRAGLAKGIIIPEFLAHQDGSDWNDYEEINGVDKARAEIMRQLDAVLAKHDKPESEAPAEPEASTVERKTVAYYLKDFLAELMNSREGREIPTGFAVLDELLDGGLYPGLYSLGAISSLGKTTLALQIGDNIAKSGQEVLIFSLEMSRNELIAKSLSRETLIRDIAENHSTRNAQTTRGILRGLFRGHTTAEWLVRESLKEYASWGENLTIIEGIGDVGVAQVKAEVESYMREHDGKPPVVIIDYLQILSPISERLTDKQAIDRNITELKRLSRDYQIPVIGISSFNRESYNAPVSMSNFKESGAVEYSSDVLIGLQYEGMNYQEGEKDGERQARIRKLIEHAKEEASAGNAVPVEARILKNRNGRIGTVKLRFTPRFNYFQEA